MSKNIKEQYNLEKGIYLDYNNIEKQTPNNIIPYIVADGNKAKYLKYSVDEKNYKLNSNIMDKAIALESKSALEAQRLRFDSYWFNDENYQYYFDILDKSRNTFRITAVERIEKNSEAVANETNINRNSKNIMDSTNDGKRIGNSYNQSIENGTTSDENAQVFRGKQGQQRVNENRQIREESIGNKNRELDNSSFS